MTINSISIIYIEIILYVLFYIFKCIVAYTWGYKLVYIIRCFLKKAYIIRQKDSRTRVIAHLSLQHASILEIQLL